MKTTKFVQVRYIRKNYVERRHRERGRDSHHQERYCGHEDEDDIFNSVTDECRDDHEHRENTYYKLEKVPDDN